MIESKASATSWEKEAVGGGAHEKWCYNCASEGHFGEDCPRPRGTKARPIIHSAFSEATASRGPYPPPRGSGTHMRWNDDGNLPYEAEGFKGANAGKKSVEKEKQRARECERERGGGTPRGRHQWFDDSPGRPWDSERKRSRSPPRRGRGYDSDREGRISVGKISGRSLADRIGPDSPSVRGARAGEDMRRRVLGEGTRRDFEREWRDSGAGGET